MPYKNYTFFVELKTVLPTLTAIIHFVKLEDKK